MPRQLAKIGGPPPGSIAALTNAGDPRSVHQAEAMVGSNAGLVHPRSLEKLRVTGLQVFEKCPYTWASQYLDPLAEQEERSGAAAIGTAAHAVCEDFLMQVHAGAEPKADAMEAWSVVPEAEHKGLAAYLESLGGLRVDRPLAIEERLQRVMVPGMPPISGQMDFVFETDGGRTLMVVDHKTNRGYNDQSWWRVQLQPLLYMWMMRDEYPGYEKYVFRIGYINMGTAVQWDTDPQDDVYLKDRVSKIWDDMQRYSEAGEWPRTINDHCSWCPVSAVCDAYSAATKNFASSIATLRLTKTNAETLEWIKQVEKIVAAERKRIEGLVAEDVRKAGGTLETPAVKYSLHYPEQRKANFLDTWQAFNAWSEAEPNVDVDKVKAMLQKVFTVGIGALDEFASAYPSFKPFVQQLAVKVPSENESLKAVPKK